MLGNFVPPELKEEENAGIGAGSVYSSLLSARATESPTRPSDLATTSA